MTGAVATASADYPVTVWLPDWDDRNVILYTLTADGERKRTEPSSAPADAHSLVQLKDYLAKKLSELKGLIEKADREIQIQPCPSSSSCVDENSDTDAMNAKIQLGYDTQKTLQSFGMHTKDVYELMDHIVDHEFCARSVATYVQTDASSAIKGLEKKWEKSLEPRVKDYIEHYHRKIERVLDKAGWRKGCGKGREPLPETVEHVAEARQQGAAPTPQILTAAREGAGNVDSNGYGIEVEKGAAVCGGDMTSSSTQAGSGSVMGVAASFCGTRGSVESSSIGGPEKSEPEAHPQEPSSPRNSDRLGPGAEVAARRPKEGAGSSVGLPPGRRSARRQPSSRRATRRSSHSRAAKSRRRDCRAPGYSKNRRRRRSVSSSSEPIRPRGRRRDRSQSATGKKKRRPSVDYDSRTPRRNRPPPRESRARRRSSIRRRRSRRRSRRDRDSRGRDRTKPSPAGKGRCRRESWEKSSSRRSSEACDASRPSNSVSHRSVSAGSRSPAESRRSASNQNHDDHGEDHDDGHVIVDSSPVAPGIIVAKEPASPSRRKSLSARSQIANRTQVAADTDDLVDGVHMVSSTAGGSPSADGSAGSAVPLKKLQGPPPIRIPEKPAKTKNPILVMEDKWPSEQDCGVAEDGIDCVSLALPDQEVEHRRATRDRRLETHRSTT
ncbi:unnamed protein product [Amoebophrya sp. A120]|nr:unnamed protein product [Amoebophrya sp. A120]|eukprot:GSA120T00022543001.1